ncbi:MAG: DUF4360 domain-containing protein [Bacteriovoracaceae bacterium]|nr:DUF4360 domain-containing protein [Bacteriovoracaceae bacterium]
MKFLTLLCLFGSFFSFSIAKLHAQAEILKEMIEATTPLYGGSSCQSGNVTFDTSELISKGILNILTPKLAIATSKKKERANCILVVPLSIPAGKSLVIKSFEENGVASSVSRKGSARLTSSIFFGTGSEQVLKSEFKGRFSKDILMTAQNVALSTVCGQSAQSIFFRLQKSALAQNASAKLSTTSIKLELVDCKE